MGLIVSIYWLDRRPGDDRNFIDQLRQLGVPLHGVQNEGTIVDLDKIRVDLNRYPSVKSFVVPCGDDVLFEYNSEARCYIKYNFFEKDLEWRVFLAVSKAAIQVFGNALALINDEVVVFLFKGDTFITNSSDELWDESSIQSMNQKHLTFNFSPV